MAHFVFGRIFTHYTRVVSLSWVGFLAQAGGLIGACLGFSFISLVEVVYWFIIRFCRLSKIEKEKERLAETQRTTEEEEAGSVDRMQTQSFEKLWCEGWESPCVETAVSIFYSYKLGIRNGHLKDRVKNAAGQKFISLQILHYLTYPLNLRSFHQECEEADVEDG